MHLAKHRLVLAAAQLRPPRGGGRRTDPRWTLRRIVRLSAASYAVLKGLGRELGVTPMQVAALLVEQAVSHELHL